jgi:hypothetical protein
MQERIVRSGIVIWECHLGESRNIHNRACEVRSGNERNEGMRYNSNERRPRVE